MAYFDYTEFHAEGPEGESCEDSAIRLSNSPKWLLFRLKDFANTYNLKVTGAKFDFEGKRLTLKDGLILQWQIRRYPNAPESYFNQQTNIGKVRRYTTTTTKGKQCKHNTRRGLMPLSE